MTYLKTHTIIVGEYKVEKLDYPKFVDTDLQAETSDPVAWVAKYLTVCFIDWNVDNISYTKQSEMPELVNRSERHQKA